MLHATQNHFAPNNPNFGRLMSVYRNAAVERLAELALARRNKRRLLAEGGREYGAGHYPLMVALHTARLVALAATIQAAIEAFKPLLERGHAGAEMMIGLMYLQGDDYPRNPSIAAVWLYKASTKTITRHNSS